AFTADSLPPGLDPPKGILLLGVQGCGKSLAAKAVAGGFQVPLVRLDFGTLYNKYHGETEKNLREALASAEQLAPCVLWIDELEKGLAASGSSEDGGVSRRVLGYFLTWMAERKSKVFLVATANAVHDLPPELLRKGRFDEIFFVDLPDHGARAEIFRLHLEKRQVAWEEFSLDTLAEAADGFSGAEIEQAIVGALYSAHADGVPVDEARLLEEIRGTRPLSVLMAEQVQALRAWALPRTVPADCSDPQAPSTRGRGCGVGGPLALRGVDPVGRRRGREAMGLGDPVHRHPFAPLRQQVVVGDDGIRIAFDVGEHRSHRFHQPGGLAAALAGPGRLRLVAQRAHHGLADVQVDEGIVLPDHLHG